MQKKVLVLILLFNIILVIFCSCGTSTVRTDSHEPSGDGIFSHLDRVGTRCEECREKLDDCPLCAGSGACDVCSSTGHLCGKCVGNPACSSCDGGICLRCEGDGYASRLTECTRCDGDGACSSCDGIGIRFSNSMYVPDRTCFSCDGTGNCRSCDGLGECGTCYGMGESLTGTRCYSCGGDGVCTRCNGQEEFTCSSCSGTGDCWKCHGSIWCPTCNGSGRS